MPCEICGIPGHEPGVVLHRVNEKGVEGIWRCEKHFEGKVDEDIQHLIDSIRGEKP